MSNAGIEETLRGIQLLEGLPEKLLQRLATVSQVVDVPAGSVLFRQGEPATTIWLVVMGNVALELCAPGTGCKRILTVGPGELLGWSPALGQERLTATARALAPVRAVRMGGKDILDLCKRNPRFGYEFMKRIALALAQRLNATRLQLVDVYGAQMPRSPDETADSRRERSG